MPAIKGKPLSKEHRNNIAKALKGKKYPQHSGAKRYNWKGSKVSYLGLHGWVRRQLGIPVLCEHQDSTCKGQIEWANRSHQYKRDLNDWVSLCRSHHRRYDGIRPTMSLKGRKLTEEHKRNISLGMRRNMI